MAVFNLCTIRPKGFLHSSAFAEVKDSLAWSLAALGHEPVLTENAFSASARNIIFGCELLNAESKIPANAIIYNLEQPSHPRMEIVRKLAQGHQVWDYSARNCEQWRAGGYDVRHVPIGYTPNLTRIPKASEQDIDICLFGWLTPRRVAILDQLKAAGLRVFASDKMYGGGRDQIISRSKICLNVHHDGRDQLEIVRVSYLMANSKCVVSESSSDEDEYPGPTGIFRTHYDHLVSVCVKNCELHRLRENAEIAAFEWIEERDFTATVKAALEGDNIGATPSTTEGTPITRVSVRFAAATMSGDMKDFVGWMRDHAQGNVMEIGVRDGASTSAFLMGLERHGGHLYSLDIADCGGLFSSHLWTFIRANSFDWNFVKTQVPYELDLLLIDGDHSRAAVLNDFNNYAPRVRRGGLILFHDIRPEYPPQGDDWPGDAVREVYEMICERTGWAHEELPGRYGLGVLTKGDNLPMRMPK